MMCTGDMPKAPDHALHVPAPVRAPSTLDQILRSVLMDFLGGAHQLHDGRLQLDAFLERCTTGTERT